MKRIIIFGAGIKGRELMKKINRNSVAYFSDNDVKKVGTYIENIPVISFEKMLCLQDDFDIVISVNSQEMRNQLIEKNIKYWNNEYAENNYFMRDDVADSIDKNLFDRYFYDLELKNAVSICECDNWYREDFCSKENQYLVSLMKKNDVNKIEEYLNKLYTGDVFYTDEYYNNRPGMRLVKNILMCEHEIPQNIHVCELACGHGELLCKLKEEGFHSSGVDKNITRVDYVRNKGVKCENASVEEVPYSDECFDVVICQECLEHVYDPDAVIREMNRILRIGGSVFCTVPYGKYCDDTTHVRHFNADKLYSLFIKFGFDIINIIKIPYINLSINNNLFLVAKKF